MLDKSRGAQPLYMQVKNIMLKKLNDGEYQVGEIIPSETELEKLFKVSRITVRLAIDEIVQMGKLEKKRGIGTVVQPYSISDYDFQTRIKSFTHEMQELGIDAVSSDVHVEKLTPPKEVAEILGANDNIFYLERVRGHCDKPMVYFQTYLNLPFELSLNADDYKNSLYEILEAKGVQLGNMHEKVTAIHANESIAKKLKIELNAPVLVRKRTVFNQNNNVYEYTVGYYNADLYEYSIEFK